MLDFIPNAAFRAYLFAELRRLGIEPEEILTCDQLVSALKQRPHIARLVDSICHSPLSWS